MNQNTCNCPGDQHKRCFVCQGEFEQHALVEAHGHLGAALHPWPSTKFIEVLRQDYEIALDHVRNAHALLDQVLAIRAHNQKEEVRRAHAA